MFGPRGCTRNCSFESFWTRPSLASGSFSQALAGQYCAEYSGGTSADHHPLDGSLLASALSSTLQALTALSSLDSAPSSTWLHLHYPPPCRHAGLEALLRLEAGAILELTSFVSHFLVLYCLYPGLGRRLFHILCLFYFSFLVS